MLVFQVSKRFPPEEKYSLTDQIRRPSPSVCINLAEAYKRRRYKDHFVSKLNDAQTENAETEVGLCFCRDCGYVMMEEFEKLFPWKEETGKLVFHMVANPAKYR
jgi:four helix bundle protein